MALILRSCYDVLLETRLDAKFAGMSLHRLGSESPRSYSDCFIGRSLGGFVWRFHQSAGRGHRGRSIASPGSRAGAGILCPSGPRSDRSSLVFPSIFCFCSH